MKPGENENRKIEEVAEFKTRTERGSIEYDEEEMPFHSRSKKNSKRVSASVSQIFALGDQRSNKASVSGAPEGNSEIKSTKNALMNVIKNPNTFGLGQNLIASSDSRLSRSRYSGVFNKGSKSKANEESAQTFDWTFALGELESEENLLLRNILMTL